MARPSKFDRSKAVETAMNAIWRDGYEATSVKALSERLGITRSSFYNAFETREELFREVVKVYAAISPDRPLGEAAPGTPIRPLLTRIVHDICCVRGGDPEARGCLIINSLAEFGPQEAVLLQMLCDAVMGSAEHLGDLLRGAQVSGELPKCMDAQATALALQNMIVGLNIMAKVTRDADALWAAASVTLRGLNLLDESIVPAVNSRVEV